MSDGTVRNDGGGDGDGGEQLDGYDRVDFANEGPPELGALKHHRVERTRSSSGLHVSLPVRLVPHLAMNLKSLATSPVCFSGFFTEKVRESEEFWMRRVEGGAWGVNKSK